MERLQTKNFLFPILSLQNQHETGLALFIAKRYPYLIKGRDRNSMTALQSLACNPSVFVAPNLREGKFMEDIMYSQQNIKSKRKSEWLVDILNEESDSEKEDSDWIEIAKDSITAIKLMSGLIERLLINSGMLYLIPSSTV